MDLSLMPFLKFKPCFHFCRWIKFEEDVEEGGERWSKPHVATLSLHSLFELRSFLLNGTVILDMDASSLDTIADLVLDNMINQGQLPLNGREKVCKYLQGTSVNDMLIFIFFYVFFLLIFCFLCYMLSLVSYNFYFLTFISICFLDSSVCLEN